jgi:thiol-disulfide isomerase/thioredoxin
MKKSRAAVLICGVACSLWLWAAPPFQADHRPAPNFKLRDLSGQNLELASYKGQVVLLNFWATWCAPCRAEIPEFVTLQSKYRGKPLRVVGISLDDRAEAAAQFYRQYKMNYPVALGNAALAEAYGGVLGLPVTFIIGCDGRIHLRFDGKVVISRLERELEPSLRSKECVQ